MSSINSNLRKGKPITFKTATVIVIALHIVGFVGLTQWSNIKAKLARTEWSKKREHLLSKEITEDNWPTTSLKKTVTNPIPKQTNVSSDVTPKVTKTNGLLEEKHKRAPIALSVPVITSSIKPFFQKPKTDSINSSITSINTFTKSANIEKPKTDSSSQLSQNNKAITDTYTKAKETFLKLKNEQAEKLNKALAEADRFKRQQQDLQRKYTELNKAYIDLKETRPKSPTIISSKTIKTTNGHTNEIITFDQRTINSYIAGAATERGITITPIY